MFSSRGGSSFPRKGDSPILLDRNDLILTGLSLDFLGGGVKFIKFLVEKSLQFCYDPTPEKRVAAR